MVLFSHHGTTSQLPSPDSRGSGPQEEHGLGSMSRTQLGSSDSLGQIRSRAYTEDTRRRSVFGSGRSRSNTTASGSSSSFQSPATSITSVDMASHSRRPSADGRLPYLPPPPPTPLPTSGFYTSESVAKSLLTRGSRILRRQGSKFSLGTSLTLDEDDEGEKERYKLEVSELFHRGQKSRSKSSATCLSRVVTGTFILTANSSKLEEHDFGTV